MKLIGASVVFVCDDKFSVIKNGGVLYKDGKIVEVGDYKALESKQVESSQFFQDSVLMPSLVNAHIHFEFSANLTSFNYGSFEVWLQSVMQKREFVLEKLESSLDSAIKTQLENGVGALGAISSYGSDLMALSKSPLKVVYFNEAIGSNPGAIDFLFSNFKERFYASKKLESNNFKPAIAIHSPYSIHPYLAREVLNIAKTEQSLVSTHFLESKSEKEWLDSSRGFFGEFLNKTLGVKEPKPLFSIESFMEQFSGLKTLYVHMLYASKNELNKVLDSSGAIVVNPRSNRLLSGKAFDIENLRELDSSLGCLLLGTDGASSNFDLSLLNEMKAFLLTQNGDLDFLAKLVILMATKNGAAYLNLDSGELAKNKSADFAVFEISGILDSTMPHIHFITNATKAKALFLNGIKIYS